MQKATFALAFAAALGQAGLADAKGTVTVQQTNGSIQTYPDSTFRVAGRTLRLTTANKKGTLVITDAACSYVGKLLRCLPYACVLEQKGPHKIPVAAGTIYFNPTNQTQTLSYSSSQVPANGVLGVMRTRIGTYVTMKGSLDGRSEK